MGGRCGARWRLVAFAVPPCLRLGSEVKHWMQQVIGDCSREIYV